MLGFLGVSTSREAKDEFADRMFQSRAGFSGRLDDIPKLLTEMDSCGFNPVLGFLGVSTFAGVPIGPSATGFNPVLGFLGVSTGCSYSDHSPLSVSIPCWVFWASRPPSTSVS